MRQVKGVMTENIEKVVPGVNYQMAKNPINKPASSDDPGWLYGYWAYGPAKTDQVRCMRCGEVCSGGITRLKRHLIGESTNRKIVKCPNTTPEIERELAQYNDKKKKKSAASVLAEVPVDVQTIVSEPDEEAEPIRKRKVHVSIHPLNTFAERVKLAKKMKKSVESTGVIVDGVWFSSQTSADKWDSVLKRSIIHENVLDEHKYTLKEIVNLLKELSLYSSVTSSKRFVEQLVREAVANMPEEFGIIESSGYGQLMVRDKLVTITPDVINDYYGIVDPEEVSDVEDWNQVAACLTAGIRSTWKGASIPTGELSSKFSILYEMAIKNWIPSLHPSSVSKPMGLLLYAIGNRHKLDLGTIIFEQIARHASSSSKSLHPIGFPSLIYELMVGQQPELKSAKEKFSSAPAEFETDHKLFESNTEGEDPVPGKRHKSAPAVSETRTSAGFSKAMRTRVIAKLESVLLTINEQRVNLNEQRVEISNLLRDLRYPTEEVEESPSEVAEEDDADI